MPGRTHRAEDKPEEAQGEPQGRAGRDSCPPTVLQGRVTSTDGPWGHVPLGVLPCGLFLDFGKLTVEHRSVTPVCLSSSHSHHEPLFLVTRQPFPRLGTAPSACPAGPALGCGTTTHHTVFLPCVWGPGCGLSPTRLQFPRLFAARWEAGAVARVSTGASVAPLEQAGGPDRAFPTDART